MNALATASLTAAVAAAVPFAVKYAVDVHIRRSGRLYNGMSGLAMALVMRRVVLVVDRVLLALGVLVVTWLCGAPLLLLAPALTVAVETFAAHRLLGPLTPSSVEPGPARWLRRWIVALPRAVTAGGVTWSVGEGNPWLLLGTAACLLMITGVGHLAGERMRRALFRSHLRTSLTHPVVLDDPAWEFTDARPVDRGLQLTYRSSADSVVLTNLRSPQPFSADRVRVVGRQPVELRVSSTDATKRDAVTAALVPRLRPARPREMATLVFDEVATRCAADPGRGRCS